MTTVTLEKDYRNVEWYEVRDKETDGLIMLAPLMTISIYFRLHKDAVERIRREHEHCELFFSRKDFAPVVVRRVNVEVR